MSKVRLVALGTAQDGGLPQAGCSTFVAESDLAGRRSMVEIPHPPMTRTMDLLQSLVDSGKKVYFSHMNHTNPALCEESPERLILEERGFSLLEEGQVFEL